MAPSPTGALHLGNGRSFLLAWLSVRAQGGKLWMRIEDIDGPRVKPAAERLTLEDLQWIGLDWDGEALRQSDRLPLYRRHIEDLLARGLAYPCVCTRKEVEVAASAPHEPWQDSTPYPGTCRDRFASVEEAQAASGRPPAIRFRVDVAAVPFDDGFRGHQEGQVRGDFVIAKRDGGPSYQLAVVADDAATGVTEVIRGDDLLASTPRQLLLYQALSLQPPRFAHVPLVVGRDGRRLAKRHGDTSLGHLRRRGVAPDAVVGYLAYLCGWAPRGHRCWPRDLVAGFRLDQLPREPVVGIDHGWDG